MTPISRYSVNLLAAMGAAMLLAGCAARPPVHSEGQVLLAQGRLDEALPRLEAELRGQPNNGELRLALAQARERVLTRQVQQLQEQQAKQEAVQRQAAEASRAAEKAVPSGLDKVITIDFKEASLNQACQVLFRSAGLNYVLDKDVRSDQPINIAVRKMAVREVLSLVLMSQQLEQRFINADTVLIYPNTPDKARDHRHLAVRSFYLTNIDAKTAAATLRTILKARDLIADDKQNVVVMRDTPEAIRMAEKLLQTHDMPEPEVMLDVEVLEIKRSRLQELGLLWPSQMMLSPLASTTSGALSLRDLLNSPRNSLAVNFPSFGINARGESGDTNLLANPRIRTRNREVAKIMIGDRVPNITTTSTATGFVAESVQYIDIGLKLDVQPTIYLDNEVAIRISLEVSNIVSQVQTKSGTLAYQIGTRNASTVLRLKDGENQVLAGLINDEERTSGSRIPGLGDMPVLGRLFGSQRDDAQKTELVLSITPRLVRNNRRPSVADSEFGIGPEGALRPLVADTGAFTEIVPPPTPAGQPAGTSQ